MKEKGFTLIELLAVIVILAIIALIATPIVLDIIDDTKKSAQLRSAENYLKAAEMAVAKKMMDDSTFKPTECSVEEGNLKCDGTIVDVSVTGEKPSGGILTFGAGSITGVELELNGKTIIREDGELVYGEPEVKLVSGLYDAEGNLIASWDELVNHYGIDLEKNVEPEFDENDEITNLSEFPGVILSSDEKLKQGTKLVIDSSITKIGYGALATNTSLKEVIIPNSVTSIGDQAFHSCNSLTRVVIPNSVTSLGVSAFYGCTSLTSITIPNSVTSIGEAAFKYCTSLIEIVMGNNVVSIGDDAFRSCTSLTKIMIPSTVTSIGHYVFDVCENLKTINYTGTQEQWNAIQLSPHWNEGAPYDLIINYNYVVQ